MFEKHSSAFGCSCNGNAAGKNNENVVMRFHCSKIVYLFNNLFPQYSSVVGQLDLTSRRSAEVITTVTTASSTTSSTKISNPKPLPTAETGARYVLILCEYQKILVPNNLLLLFSFDIGSYIHTYMCLDGHF